MNIQTPISKLQRNVNREAPTTVRRGLVFGSWDFSGAWMLGFGCSSLHRSFRAGCSQIHGEARTQQAVVRRNLIERVQDVVTSGS